jgi:hypothetical protein
VRPSILPTRRCPPRTPRAQREAGEQRLERDVGIFDGREGLAQEAQQARRGGELATRLHLVLELLALLAELLLDIRFGDDRCELENGGEGAVGP